MDDDGSQRIIYNRANRQRMPQKNNTAHLCANPIRNLAQPNSVSLFTGHRYIHIFDCIASISEWSLLEQQLYSPAQQGLLHVLCTWAEKFVW